MPRDIHEHLSEAGQYSRDLSSYDPTSATAGHAAAAAPIMPWPKPWETFEASVNNAQAEELPR